MFELDPFQKWRKEHSLAKLYKFIQSNFVAQIGYYTIRRRQRSHAWLQTAATRQGVDHGLLGNSAGLRSSFNFNKRKQPAKNLAVTHVRRDTLHYFTRLPNIGYDEAAPDFLHE